MILQSLCVNRLYSQNSLQCWTPSLYGRCNCLRTLRRICFHLCFLHNLQSNSLHSSQSFIAGLGNMRRWQEEAVLPTVLELKCEGVFDAKVVGPIIRTTRSQVWRTEKCQLCVHGEQINQPCLKQSKPLLTYCFCSRTIYVGVSIISSDFLGSFLGHLKLLSKSAFKHVERPILY